MIYRVGDLLKHNLSWFPDKQKALISCSGYCVLCGTEHSLYENLARHACRELMEKLESMQRIDFLSSDSNADPHFSTDYLFGEARGQMFGVLVYQDSNKSILTLKAFSGQYNGIWEVAGWAPPLFDVGKVNKISYKVEKEIKQIGNQIADLPDDSTQKEKLKKQRKLISQKLMRDIHSLYSVTNFRGETRSLYEVLIGPQGLPSGTGDCCAPKLLNYAAKHDLRPLGLAEFYWGKENKSDSRQHGQFYPSCEDKCGPILGFMLCGLEGYTCYKNP